MAVIDQRAKQKIKTSRQFMFILVYAFVLVILPFTSCNITPREDVIESKPAAHPLTEDDKTKLVISHDHVTYYLFDIGNVPLPNGFMPDNKRKTIYETPAGRIIEVYANGTGREKDVKNFYSETLPQLGWKKDLGFYSGGLDMKFSREGERLRLNINNNSLEMDLKKSERYNDEYKLKLQDDIAKLTLRFSLYPNE